MSLNKLFDSIDKARDSANWKAAFGAPQQVDDKTIIPVAQAGYGFGLGFGHSAAPAEAGDSADEAECPPGGEGAGGGGGASTKPLGVIVVRGDEVDFEPVMNMGVIGLAAIGLAALAVLEFGKTLRVFSRLG